MKRIQYTVHLTDPEDTKTKDFRCIREKGEFIDRPFGEDTDMSSPFLAVSTDAIFDFSLSLLDSDLEVTQPTGTGSMNKG